MLQSGEVPLSTIDDKASRILRLIFRTAMNRQKPYGAICTDEHYAAAREIGSEGIVLLKNAPVANVEDQTVEGFETVTHPKFEMYQDKAGEFRFRLKARNGEIIGVSEGYTSKANCVNGVESVKKNAAEAEIVEE